MNDSDIIASVETALAKLLAVIERIHERVGLAKGRIDALVAELSTAIDPATPCTRFRNPTFIEDLPDEELATVFAEWAEENCRTFEERYGEDWRARLEVNAQRVYGTDWKRILLRNAARRT